MSIDFSFDDGSTYTVPELHERGMRWKFSVTDQFIEDLKYTIEKYWSERRCMTKFGERDWQGEEFATKADLCASVIYNACRPAILALVMAEASGNPAKVIALHDDGSSVVYDTEHLKSEEEGKADEERESNNGD